MKKYQIEIKWAIIFMIMSLLWMLLEVSLGWHDELIEWHPYLTMIYMIPAAFVYIIGLIDKRDNALGGKMTWKEGFISGLIISVIVAILSPLSMWLTFEFITPEYFDNAIEYSVSTNEYTLEAAQSYFNYNSYVLQSIAGAIFMGLVTSSIVAAFVRKS